MPHHVALAPYKTPISIIGIPPSDPGLSYAQGPLHLVAYMSVFEEG